MLHQHRLCEHCCTDGPVFKIQGEVGQSKLSPFDKLQNAIKDFEKKFKDKTKNNWSDRANFVSHAGKYTMIEVDGEQDAEVKVGVYFTWAVTSGLP